MNFPGSALTMESNGLPFSLSFVFSSDQWPAGAKNVSDNGNRFIHAKVGRPVMDPYYAAAILDLKRGLTGISNTHAIFRMHNLFWVHCLCSSSLVSNPTWRLRDKGLLFNFVLGRNGGYLRERRWKLRLISAPEKTIFVYPTSIVYWCGRNWENLTSSISLRVGSVFPSWRVFLCTFLRGEYIQWISSVSPSSEWIRNG